MSGAGMTLQDCGVHSWAFFCDEARRRLTEKPRPGAEDSSGGLSANGRDTGGNGLNSDWYGTPTLDAAVRMAVEGWPEGAERVAETLDNMPAESHGVPAWDLDYVGVRPCVEAYMANDPACLWRHDAGVRDKPRMTLCVPASYSAGVNAQHVNMYAAAVAAVARMLEASGIDVAIWGVRTGKSSGRAGKIGFAYAVQVREFGEPLDLAKVAFAFHPSMLRRLHFAFGEIRDDLAKCGAARDGYAMPYELNDVDLRATFGTDALSDGMLTILPSPNVTSRAFGGGGAWNLGKCDSVEAICEAFRTCIERQNDGMGRVAA